MSDLHSFACVQVLLGHVASGEYAFSGLELLVNSDAAFLGTLTLDSFFLNLKIVRLQLFAQQNLNVQLSCSCVLQKKLLLDRKDDLKGYFTLATMDICIASLKEHVLGEACMLSHVTLQ
jgi:hypothetical protein